MSRCLNVGLPGGCHEWRGARALRSRLDWCRSCWPAHLLYACLLAAFSKISPDHRQPALQLTTTRRQKVTGPPTGQPPKYPSKQGIGPLASRNVAAPAAALVMNLTKDCRRPSSGDAPARHPGVGTHAEVPGRCHGTEAGGRPRRHLHFAHVAARSSAVRSPPLQAKIETLLSTPAVRPQ